VSRVRQYAGHISAGKLLPVPRVSFDSGSNLGICWPRKNHMVMTPVGRKSVRSRSCRPSGQKPSRGHQPQQPCSKSGKSRGGTVSHAQLHCSPWSKDRGEYTLPLQFVPACTDRTNPAGSWCCHPLVLLLRSSIAPRENARTLHRRAELGAILHVPSAHKQSIFSPRP
jgi:hypothetical protein